MKKFFAIATLVAVALTGCVKNEVITPNAGEIQFKNFTLSSKALILPAENAEVAFPNDQTFGAIAYNGATEYVGAAAAEGTKAKLAEVAAKLNDGSLKVFDCATFTVKGETLTEYLADVDDAGDFVPETNVIKTENGITFFDESGEGLRSAPYFDLDIDGITNLDA